MSVSTTSEPHTGHFPSDVLSVLELDFLDEALAALADFASNCDFDVDFLVLGS